MTSKQGMYRHDERQRAECPVFDPDADANACPPKHCRQPECGEPSVRRRSRALEPDPFALRPGLVLGEIRLQLLTGGEAIT